MRRVDIVGTHIVISVWYSLGNYNDLGARLHLINIVEPEDVSPI